MANLAAGVMASRLLSAALLGLLAAGCGGGKAPKDVRRAVDIALLPAGDNKRELRKFVEDEGFEGLKSVLDQADENHLAARLTAIAGLGMLKDDPKATELLLQLVDGQDSESAHWAVIALGEQGAPEAKDAIAKMMKSDDPRRRVGACFAIRQYGDTSLYSLLDAASGDPAAEVRQAAAEAKRLIQLGQVVTEGKTPQGE